MKKNLILLLVALVALGIVYFLKDRRFEKRTTEISLAYDSTRIAEAAHFKVARSTDTVVVVFDDSRWVVLPDSFPADTGKVNKILQRIFTLRDGEVISRNEERLSEFGVDSAEAKSVTIWDKQGSVMASATVGKTSGADYNSTYWKYPDKPEVYRTPGNFTWEIAYTRDELRSRELFVFDPKEARTLSVAWKDSNAVEHRYKLEVENDSTWMVVEPVQDTVRDSGARNMIQRFSELSIDAFVTDSDSNVAKVDLTESSAIKISLTLKDGKAFELKGSRSFDGYVYVQHPSYHEKVMVSDWRFEPFKTDSERLTSAMADGHHAHDGHGH